MRQKLILRIETLRYVMERARYNYLREMAAEEFNRLLDVTIAKYGDKVTHIGKIDTPNVSGLEQKQVEPEEMLGKCEQLKKVLETMVD
ncbi:MAG: hypothetical protein ISS77_07605 [Phycisphaerae bacterium]|nr:hypothetical protein [Phycisphaerae bacterium]